MKTHTVRRGEDREEIVAALAFDLVARPLDAKVFRSLTAYEKTTSQRPWKWYNAIGELHQGISRGARIAGFARIQARKVERDGTPGEVVTSGKAAEIAEACQSPYGGQRGLIERFYTLMKVPGACYAIRTRDGIDGAGEPTGYDFIGAHEIDQAGLDATSATIGERPIPGEVLKSELKRITLPSGSPGGIASNELFVPIRPEDLLGRVWRPSGKWVQEADSPMRALDTECEILNLLILGLKGKLMSRLALNGILYWPSEVTDVGSAVPRANDSPGPTGIQNRTLARLVEAASQAVLNYEDPRSSLPIFASGPAEMADAIKHIILDRELYETDIKLRAEMLDKILTSLDVQKSQVKGDADANHWNGWMASDDEIRVAIKPDLEMMSWALTRLVHNREMEAAGIQPRTAMKTMLWFDLSAAISNVNLAEDARQASDRILISPAAARKATGFTEAQAPSNIEYIRGIGLMMKNPYLATFGMDEAKDIDWDKAQPSKTGPAPDSPGDTPESGPGNAPGKRGGRSESDTPRRLKPA